MKEIPEQKGGGGELMCMKMSQGNPKFCKYKMHLNDKTVIFTKKIH